MQHRASLSPDRSAATPRALRILIVDDEIEMAALIADELGDRGYATVPLDSGAEAEKRLEGEVFDAIITDLTMPGVDGLELLRVSRSLDPTRPVIVMTGPSTPGAALEANRQGVYRYITKPFTLSTLVHLLEAVLAEAGSE